MKKLLSMLLALIMCTGVLISCDNGDVTSSSEAQSQSESVSESQSVNDEEQLALPKTHVTTEPGYEYYKRLPNVTYIGDDFPKLGEYDPLRPVFGKCFKIITSYEQLCSLVSTPEKIGEEVFENHFVFAICIYGSSGSLIMGRRDFQITDGVAHIFSDSIYSSTYQPVSRIITSYCAIPKALLTTDVSEIVDYQYHGEEYRFYNVSKIEAGAFDYADKTCFVFTNQKELDDFKAKHEFDMERFNLSEDTKAFVIIYNSSKSSNEILCEYSDISVDKGELIIYNTVIKNEALESSPIAPSFDVISISSDKRDIVLDDIESINIVVRESTFKK